MEVLGGSSSARGQSLREPLLSETELQEAADYADAQLYDDNNFENNNNNNADDPLVQLGGSNDTVQFNLASQIEDSRSSKSKYTRFKAKCAPVNRIRMRIRNVTETLWWQVGVILLILLDACLLIIDLAVNNETTTLVIFIVTIILLTIFALELLLRLFALGSDFFRDWLNILDAVIIIASIIVAIVVFEVARYLVLARIVRVVVRSVRICLFCFRERKRVQMGVRHLIGENKQRYRKDGFDLDLAYVSARVIVMSVPAIKLEGFYRNDIGEVARFFNKKHRNHYRIYNCCAERKYPTKKFNDQVVRYEVDDHNVPPLAMMLEFCRDAEVWMKADPQNIIAVHCRGGKGRSGTMVCAWLLYSGECNTAKDALDLFGRKRTDRLVGKKFQGVETQSQCRYVKYFEWVINNNKTLPFHVPQKAVTSITITSKPALEAIAVQNRWRKGKGPVSSRSSSLAERMKLISSKARRKKKMKQKLERELEDAEDAILMEEREASLDADDERAKKKAEGEEDEEDVEDLLDGDNICADLDDEAEDVADAIAALGKDKEIDEEEENEEEQEDIEEQDEVWSWKLIVTHTEGRKLEPPMVFYPNLASVDETSNSITFLHYPNNDCIDERGPSSVLIKADTRMELRCKDERYQGKSNKPDPKGKGKAKILLYFWLHTFFLKQTSDDGIVSDRFADEAKQDQGEMVVDFAKADIDRGRYKGCPFKRLTDINVRLFLSDI